MIPTNKNDLGVRARFAFVVAVVVSAAGGCEDGMVGAECDKGLWPCEDGCFDICGDELNCGGCGVECAAGEMCFHGVCRTDCDGGDCSPSCLPPDVRDSESEADLRPDGAGDG